MNAAKERIKDLDQENNELLMKNVRVNNKMNRLIVKHNMLCDFLQRISKNKKTLERKNKYWKVKYIKEKQKTESTHDMIGIIADLGTQVLQDTLQTPPSQDLSPNYYSRLLVQGGA